jgi:hypothetical protein
MAAEPNAFEAERLRKIAANRKLLEELGLVAIAGALRVPRTAAPQKCVLQPHGGGGPARNRTAACQQQRTQTVARLRRGAERAACSQQTPTDAAHARRRRNPAATLPAREPSSRIGAAERVSYAEHREPLGEERRPRAARALLESVWRGFACSPEDSEAAFDSALDDAAARLDRACFIKQLAPSIISGGFWFSLPCASLPDSVVAAVDGSAQKTTIWLEDEEGVHFPCIWLKRPTGAGLSGGWRGFAIAHALNAGDCLVFEQVVQPPAFPLRLRVTIHRAQEPTADQVRASAALSSWCCAHVRVLTWQSCAAARRGPVHGEPRCARGSRRGAGRAVARALGAARRAAAHQAGCQCRRRRARCPGIAQARSRGGCRRGF